MEQKTKFILVGLTGVALIFIFLYLQALNSKQLVIKERDNFKNENVSLAGRIEKNTKDLREAQNKMSSLRLELETVSKEREDLQKNYETARQDKEELLTKLQSQVAQVQVRPVQDASGRSDEYWAGVLKEKTELQMQLGSIHKDLKTYQVKNEELLRDKSSLELDITGLKRQQEELQRQIEYNKKIMDSIAQELVWEKNEKLKIEENIAPFKKENAQLIRQLKGLNKQKIDLERKLQRIQEDKGGLADKLGDMETMLVDKISQINNLKDELEDMRHQMQQEGRIQPKAISEKGKESVVELPPIVVRPAESTQKLITAPAITMPSQEAVSGAAKPRGSVLTVNRESNFVIVDLGDDAGVKSGAIFQVYRGKDPVAIIEVIKTSKSVSACDIKEEKTPVKVGDVLR
ncbi:MAG: hypothetical protein ISS89_04475 [Candidatus Omnitrophica bacterium]|nr:hypothetical protein [Candidatus Omnitrophota bacterium]